jgi:hypothetical protein
VGAGRGGLLERCAGRECCSLDSYWPLRNAIVEIHTFAVGLVAATEKSHGVDGKAIQWLADRLQGIHSGDRRHAQNGNGRASAKSSRAWRCRGLWRHRLSRSCVTARIIASPWSGSELSVQQEPARLLFWLLFDTHVDK